MSSSLATQNRVIESKWSDAVASALDPVELLVYRSNLLGSEPSVTNYGGGNTSSKVETCDPLTGEPKLVLWVKGSGGDLRTMQRSGLASLYMDRLMQLEEIRHRRNLHEDEIVALYPHCTFGLNPTAASIDTPLHALLPFAHVDHMHPDAVIAIAASEGAEELTRTVYGDEVGFLPWKRPGFDLAIQLRDLVRERPHLKGVVLGSHGLINWADDPKECYELTLRLINQAAKFIAANAKPSFHPFGDRVREPVSDARKAWLQVLPILRGCEMFEGKRMIAHWDSSDGVMDFVSRSQMPRLAALGTSCPDHFLRTKIAPMVLDLSSTDYSDAALLRTKIEQSLQSFRNAYREYYERCKRPNSPTMRNPNPSVVLIPGLGMATFGKSKQEAKVTCEFYCRAIEVMRGAETIGKYRALPEQEAFDIEYWLLEEAKLRRQPPEKDLSRQVAIITGGAQGIGLATAIRMASLGASIALLDVNADKLDAAIGQAAAAAGSELSVLGIRCDVTDAAALAAAFEECVLQFGGLDVLVVCAGNARRGTVADTSAEDYDFQRRLLIDATFHSFQNASRVMISQGSGGSIVFVGSKNAVAAGSNAAMYSASKAFGLHLTRTTAVDLAKHGIRSNAVNPDAVLEGSGIWSDAWREQTARSLGIAPDQLEQYYIERSLLRRPVRPDDVAAAIVWLANERESGRTTGCVIPVDAGNREGFLR